MAQRNIVGVRPVRALAAGLTLPVALAGCLRMEAPARASAPAVALGPWVLSPRPTQATVAWTTAEPSVGEVAYGTTAALGSVAHEKTATARIEHRVVLSELSPSSRYLYRVEAEVPAAGSFSTAADPSGSLDRPFRVLVYGDNRSSGGDHELLARAASAEPVELALHTGDMVVDAKDEHLWSEWFDAERELLSRTALVPTVGNHEITDRGAAYARHFLEPGKPAWQSIDFGPVHLLVLDSFEESAGANPHQGGISDAQRAWAEADARKLKTEQHLWLLVHQGPHSHPLRPRPGHGGSEPVRRLVASLMRIHPVEAIWAGHEHFYERGNIEGMRYFVVGGGGAPLEDPDAAVPGVQAARKALSYVAVDVCGCHVTGKAKDIFGNVLDSFTLADCPVPCGPRVASAGGAK
jgi:hypothetical protein